MSKTRRVVSGEENAVAVKDERGRWEDLNPEILALIFVRIPADEMVRKVPLVCKPWMEAVAGPYCWLEIDVADWCRRRNDSRVVDLAVGKLVRWSKCTFQRLSAYRLGNPGFVIVANRGKCLTVLQMPMSDVTDDMVLKHITSLPNLKVLDISDCSKITVKGLEAFGNQCKSLVCLKRNMSTQRTCANLIDDSEAKMIAKTMSNIQQLELCYGRFSNAGLSEIVNNCKSLTHLDIDGSLNVNLKVEGDLEESLQRIEYFAYRRPCIDDSDESSGSEGNYDIED
ncbi:F-box protein FBW2-like [Cynara cardunculus var. scolymus]|uniref:F-box domain, cyclin-like protein n=1 Tax=Cynara cardunculus var. scolymus TaxID=59895 RepID=A0A103XV35_CYNCS|nr:F-box protein FBW2-like [Cynara cardunculus var. scolymus]KVH97380.1 hypothetical protein Ccrd_000530 [Cynara cardunculus var. scolymus]